MQQNAFSLHPADVGVCLIASLLAWSGCDNVTLNAGVRKDSPSKQSEETSRGTQWGEELAAILSSPLHPQPCCAVWTQNAKAAVGRHSHIARRTQARFPSHAEHIRGRSDVAFVIGLDFTKDPSSISFLLYAWLFLNVFARSTVEQHRGGLELKGVKISYW